MSNYTINFKKSAIKELFKLPNKEVSRITAIIASLAEDTRPSGCKKLKGYANLWRVRSGKLQSHLQYRGSNINR